MNVQPAEMLLKQLKLKTAASELKEVLGRAKKAVSLDWMVELLQREVDARKERSFIGRIKKAKFPEMKAIEEFDWNFNPEIGQEKITELTNLKFLDGNRVILFLGQPGTGKTHIALSLGLIAVREGHKVYCSSLKKLSADINKAKEKNELDLLFKKILTSKLWILDDWGVVSLPREIAEEIFDLLDRRKYSSAMILTSNRDVSEWPEVFPDPVLASAAIDRIFDRAEIEIFKGKSYRLGGKIEINRSFTESINNLAKGGAN